MSAARGGVGRCPTIKAGRPLEQTLPPSRGPGSEQVGVFRGAEQFCRRREAPVFVMGASPEKGGAAWVLPISLRGWLEATYPRLNGLHTPFPNSASATT